MAIFLASNVIFNTVGIGVISMFWGLVNSLQLIAYFPLLAIILPANSKIAYELTYSIAAFDLIPTDPLTDWIDGLLEDVDNTANHDIHVSETAQEMEYDSANPIMNMFLGLCVLIVIGLLLLFSYVALCMEVTQRNHCCCVRIRNKAIQLKKDILWNSFIRFYIEEYIAISIAG